MFSSRPIFGFSDPVIYQHKTNHKFILKAKHKSLRLQERSIRYSYQTSNILYMKKNIAVVEGEQTLSYLVKST